MNVREGPGTNYRFKKIKELTTDGKKNATSKNPKNFKKKKEIIDMIEIY